MDTVEILVVVGALAGVALVFWYFFPGKNAYPRARTGEERHGEATVNDQRQPHTVRLRVEGMTCSNCVRHVARALEAVPGVTGAEVDLDGGKASVRIEPGAVEPGALAEAVAEAGYRAEPLED